MCDKNRLDTHSIAMGLIIMPGFIAQVLIQNLEILLVFWGSEFLLCGFHQSLNDSTFLGVKIIVECPNEKMVLGGIYLDRTIYPDISAMVGGFEILTPTKPSQTPPSNTPTTPKTARASLFQNACRAKAWGNRRKTGNTAACPKKRRAQSRFSCPAGY